ncbi:hypothetical protein [Thioalbus denitrificans]|uniref:Uncharacterized protein n=1 Tax=Thioalbus denitrificans TaxID=547122 RepID=A0A369CIM4_9GAMM|nr:hypothetical protein [Thioalbus denitrificans]RCX31704.1 hypothetical protein DFQ59_10251 [Thioalbus denitrificans]
MDALYPEIRRLQENIDRRLGYLSIPDAKRFAQYGGSLPAPIRKFTDEVLIRFDADHTPRLMHESKMLSAGDGSVADVSVPAVWERTVLREALYRMEFLPLVDAGTDAFASSISIAYSHRDTTAAGRTDTRVYEGQEIPRAGVVQTSELAYPIPQKIAFELSDELRHLATARSIDYDPVVENMNNSARIIAEDSHHLVMNEFIHASDEYGAVPIVGEDLELQADGAKRVFILDHFPVVRPRKTYDLQGAQIGSTKNPITVTYNGGAVAEWDGTGEQVPGIYYVLNYNLGEIYLSDEAGEPLIPADGTAYAISYSYATNAYAFDTDTPVGTDPDEYMDTLLYRLALRKGLLEDTRYYRADLGLMSGTVATMVGQAKKFGANFKVPGTDLTVDGSIGRIKDIPFTKTAGPGLWFGDQRILVGQRGTTRFRVLKPWQVTSLINQKGPNGRFTGKKEAYGDQWIALHTPSQLKAAYTTIVLYSASSRVARANP